jgi:Rrf2 family iron-sulfur cluster assembly transcriptional regulator
MKLSTKGSYAVRAVIDLNKNSKGKPVRLLDISDRQGISQPYLEQLFRRLRIGGVVKSVKGPNGGYLLAKDSSTISVIDILIASGEKINIKDSLDVKPSSEKGFVLAHVNENNNVETSELNIVKDIFDTMENNMLEYLKSIKLNSLEA